MQKKLLQTTWIKKLEKVNEFFNKTKAQDTKSTKL